MSAKHHSTKTLEVRYQTGQSSPDYSVRDKHMAENALWLNSYFPDVPVMIWAHNMHISRYDNGIYATMGHDLDTAVSDQYVNIGFAFAEGGFNAVGNTSSFAVEAQTIDVKPLAGSLNSLFYQTSKTAFSVSIEDLKKHPEWVSAMASMKYFQIGAGFSGDPTPYYLDFSSNYFNRLIYFQTTNASNLIN